MFETRIFWPARAVPYKLKTGCIALFIPSPVFQYARGKCFCFSLSRTNACFGDPDGQLLRKHHAPYHRPPLNVRTTQAKMLNPRSPVVLVVTIAISVTALYTTGLSQAAPVIVPQTQATAADEKNAATNAAAEKIATSASNAQNNIDFKFAASQWQKLINDHPTWSKIATAKLNLGICLFQQTRYADAIAPLKAAVSSGDEIPSIPRALLFLGFAQMKYGDQLALAQSNDQQQEAGIYLTTSTRTFGKIIKQYPDYKDADQALYFQGQAFYKLQRYDEAVAAFQGLEAFKNAKFKNVAQYDLASTWQQIGEFDLALSAFDKYLQSIPADDTESIDDVRLQIAKLKMRLATSARARQESVEATELLKDADRNLDSISRNAQSGLQLEAIFQQALVAGSLDDFTRAAKLFEQVAAAKDAANPDQAAVMAGREWIRARQYPAAIKALVPQAVPDSQFGLEATILLSNAYRSSGAAEKASTLTQAWIANSVDSPLHVALLMEHAEAAYATPKMKPEAARRFQEIAEKFPADTDAPDALFNATAAWWESFETDKAIETGLRFMKAYPQHALAMDIQEILGDAWLVKENFVEGEKIFRNLARRFPDHKRQVHWALRIGWALYLQKKYSETETWLTEQVDSIKLPKLASEAWHWTGVSQFQQKKYDGAMTSLQNAIDSVQQWERTDETLLALLRCQLALDSLDDARLTAAKIASQFPKSPTIAESVFRIGETLYEKNELTDALAQYGALLQQFPDSEFAPAALLGQGWALLRTGQAEAAETSFNTLIERFPDDTMAQQARMARSVAHRKLGKSDQAIEALKQYLATAPAGDARDSSQFELGLAYVENENWAEAENVFRDLLRLANENRLADRTRYELAWALEALNKSDESTAQFRDLAETFPHSPLAAEANFKVASALYDQKKYDDAAVFYANVINNRDASSDLLEKAMYKAAWSSYKQNRFEQAADGFEKQIARFTEGDLSADGQFMLAQSWFENENWAKALEAYVVAKPVVMKSKTTPDRLKWLTMINGAKSANQQKRWQQAIDFATPLTISEADESTKHEAWFEIGQARLGLKQEDGALNAWEHAANSSGKTGAHAHVMKGEVLFKQKRFDDAIDEFKLVFYGYGGTQSEPEIQALQAYAVYEAARCSYVRVSKASQRLKPQLIKDAIRLFTYLIENYPEQSLAKDARKQLETLKQIQPGN